MAGEQNVYTLELEWPDEVGIVVEALRIQRERWQEALTKKLANDPSVSTISLEDIQQGIERHERLLKRLPDHGLSF